MIYDQDDIDDFKCTLCKDLFCPPHNLPYLLPCTHSICTNCINKISVTNHSQTVICAEDLETSYLSQIRLNTSARRALQRLVKQHKNFNQNNQLFRIQALSKHFQQVLQVKSKEKDHCKQLLQTIIDGEINRLKMLQRKFNQQLQGPFKKVEQWRNIVKQYLFNVKSMDRNSRGEQIFKQLNFYIEQGRRIKTELNQYEQLKFEQISSLISSNPKICLQSQFSLKKFTQKIQVWNQKAKVEEVDSMSSKGSNTEDVSDKRLLLSSHRVVGQKRLENSKCEPLNEIVNENNDYCSKNKKSKTSELSSKENTIKNESIYNSKSEEEEHKIKFLINKSQNSAFLSNCSKRQHLFILSQDDSFPILPVKQQLQSDEILLTQKEDIEQIVPNINFMQQWEIVRSLPSEHIQTRKRQPFNWEKQKNQYIRKMQMTKVKEAKDETMFQNGCLQLINYPLCEVEIYLYLQCWDWKKLQTIKFVRTGFNDSQLNDLLNFMVNGKVQTLVLCGNSLSEVSLDALLNFVKMNRFLHNVYISKNNINLLRGRSREKVGLLRQKGINLYT